MKKDKKSLFLVILVLLKSILSVHVCANMHDSVKKIDDVSEKYIFVLPKLKNWVQEARRNVGDYCSNICSIVYCF